LQAAAPPSSTLAATAVEKPQAVSMPTVRLTFLFSIVYKQPQRIPAFPSGTLCKIAKFSLDYSGCLDDLAAFQ